MVTSQRCLNQIQGGGGAIVGPQYCASYPVDLAIVQKVLTITDGNFGVTDVNGNLIFKVKGFLLSLRDRRVLLDAAGRPIITLREKALAFTAQLNYELNNEVHTSRTLAQEERDLHLKANDDLKAVNAKLEAVVKEREEMAKELGKLKNELEEQKKDNIQLRETNKKLEEDKAVTLDLMEDIKTRLTAEFKEKKETAVDSAMYWMWAYNEELDTSFLGPLEASFLERWNARLEKEEADQLEKDKATPSTVSEGAQEDSHAIRPEGSGATDAEKAKETPLL
ncbi:uncharacterized protein LOC133800800 isoform X3 [Humulus lupulus]|uniref:uncharacterized protein LOC133800800 isoform X3 n=1 Tax=Humulus lupulus TaxID=3486 RepID=UPI002B411DA6|nr:uncharacterized protein LOC133800800 isoform X3 [Humulus lupulus]